MAKTDGQCHCVRMSNAMHTPLARTPTVTIQLSYGKSYANSKINANSTAYVPNDRNSNGNTDKQRHCACH
eukprot:3847827-Lingulodinium_polyedra.AAC.1